MTFIPTAHTATLDAANPRAATITNNGADDASVINLAGGNDLVTVGSARETINGGTGNDIIQVTAATIAATIDGGSGRSSLYVPWNECSRNAGGPSRSGEQRQLRHWQLCRLEQPG